MQHKYSILLAEIIVKVFGWTEKEDVKRNLETLILSKEINSSILSEISEEISKNYVIKDWKKFDYISIEPTTTIIVLMCIITFLIQISFYCWAYFNQINSFQDIKDLFS